MNIGCLNAGGIQPDYDPGEDIAEDEGLPQFLRDDRADQRGNNNNDNIGSYIHDGGNPLFEMLEAI
jgi:hypothetical protein